MYDNFTARSRYFGPDVANHETATTMALFAMGAMINHSCQPNVMYSTKSKDARQCVRGKLTSHLPLLVI